MCVCVFFLLVLYSYKHTKSLNLDDPDLEALASIFLVRKMYQIWLNIPSLSIFFLFQALFLLCYDVVENEIF